MDENSSFEDICNEMENKISNWQEYYVLIHQKTRTKVVTSEVFNELIETEKKETAAGGGLFSCQPKFTFYVTDETGKKDSHFSFPFFPSPIPRFKKFLKKITENCAQWDENCEVVHNAASNKRLIVNELSMNKMIANCNSKNRTSIFVCLKTKVCDCMFFDFSGNFLHICVSGACVFGACCDDQSEQLSGGGRFIKC